MDHKIKMIIFFCMSCMVGCIPATDPSNALHVGIWTDMAAERLDGISLYANEHLVGPLTPIIAAHDCTSPALLDLLLPYGSATTLAIRNLEGQQTDLARIEVFGFNTGMSIEQYGTTNLQIDGTTDDRCTQVYLSW